MKIEQLTQIIKQANLRAIRKVLVAEGFRECKRDKALRRMPLHRIEAAPHEKTLYFPDSKGNEYLGDLCRRVKGFEQYEFVIVRLLAPFEHGVPRPEKKILIYAREA